uniref:Uncharacterized protein n=1 Tax=Meloidogyne enterolobii TaxID=390850 RepID=A0A6V7Y5V5_MELEN|nr:unnamed protein product [Meloidogyne enterolobii]
MFLNRHIIQMTFNWLCNTQHMEGNFLKIISPWDSPLSSSSSPSSSSSIIALFNPPFKMNFPYQENNHRKFNIPCFYLIKKFPQNLLN